VIDMRTGNPLTTDRPDAAERYLLAVDRILGSEAGAEDALDRALALDGNFAVALAARYLLAKDAKSADAGHFRERALQAAIAALPWERAHIFALLALLDDPYTNLATTESYIAAHPNDLLVVSQLCGYLIFYGGAHKLVDAVSQFASGKYSQAADILKLISAEQRVAMGGSRVERVLIDLLEARAVELAA
jgi:hypothetical protein